MLSSLTPLDAEAEAVQLVCGEVCMLRANGRSTATNTGAEDGDGDGK